MKNNKCLNALGLLLFVIIPLHANAESDSSVVDILGASGSVRPAYWNRDLSYSDQRNYFVGSAWLTLRPQEVSGFKGYFDGYVVGQDLTRSNYSQGEAREIYVEKSVGALDFKIGRQITIWGRADKINPTDNLSVRDYTLLMTDDEDQRKGVFATQAIYNIEKMRLIAIWQPEWRSPTYPIPPQPGLTFQDIRPDNPANDFAFKIDSTSDAFDWSFSYFNGYNKVPDVGIISTSPTTQLSLNHGHIQVYGGDIAKSFGPYGIRGEVAYTQTDDPSGSNPLVQNSNVFAVLGADRSFEDVFNVNAQVLYRNVLNFQDTSSISDPTTKQLAQEEATLTNQKYREQFGASLRPSYKLFNETLEIELALVSWFANGDSLIRPKITYAFTDKIKGIIGGNFYNGPADTFFGELKDVSSVFSELRYIF